MTKDSGYTAISGVKADLTKTKSATQGITSFEVAGLYSVKLSYSGSDSVVSTMIR